jgi:hypothetical protein
MMHWKSFKRVDTCGQVQPMFVLPYAYYFIFKAVAGKRSIPASCLLDLSQRFLRFLQIIGHTQARENLNGAA